MKNLILMHLESLNKLNYDLNRDFYPFLHKFEKECVISEKYYSTATSTLMVLSDIMYGCMEQFESCKSLQDIPKNYNVKQSLFDCLKKEGYDTNIFIYPESGDVKSSERRHFLGFDVETTITESYSKFFDLIDNSLNSERFALLICPTISNLSINHHIDITDYNLWETNWEIGYRFLDRICERVVDLLRKKNKLDDTVIIFYGDHGDDYWGHGMHRGLTHAIEPNNLLIHTPFFIWNSNKKFEIENGLIQSSDLRGISMQLLKEERIEINRHYIISRNEYAAQNIRIDSFNKAYSICDGRYNMIVSNYGLELYDTVMDPACTNNLLKFFVLDKEILKFHYDSNLGYHYGMFFNSRQQRIIRVKFYTLCRQLKEEVLKLYSSANLTESDMLAEMKFDQIKY